MKKIGILLVALSSLLMFSGCRKDSKAVEKFVGTYSVTATMNIFTVIDGISHPASQDLSGYLVISKSDNGNKIVEVSEFYETTATVDGKTITFNPVSANGANSEQGWSMLLNITFQSGKLDGDILKFNGDITGSYYYNGSAYPIFGNISHVAKKL